MFSWIFELQNKDFLSRPIFRLSTYKKLSLFYIKNKINPVSLISMGDKREKITHTVEPPASSVSRLTDGARETLIAAISGCDDKHCFRVSKRESTPHKKRKSKSNNRESWLQTYANCKGSHLNMSAVFEYTKTCMLCVKKDTFCKGVPNWKSVSPPPPFLEIFGLFVFSDVFTSVIVFGILWRFVNMSTWFSPFWVPLPTKNLLNKHKKK